MKEVFVLEMCCRKGAQAFEVFHSREQAVEAFEKLPVIGEDKWSFDQENSSVARAVLHAPSKNDDIKNIISKF